MIKIISVLLSLCLMCGCSKLLSNLGLPILGHVITRDEAKKPKEQDNYLANDCFEGHCRAGYCYDPGCKAGDCKGNKCRAGNCYGKSCKPGVCEGENCQNGIAREKDPWK